MQLKAKKGVTMALNNKMGEKRIKGVPKRSRNEREKVSLKGLENEKSITKKGLQNEKKNQFPSSRTRTSDLWISVFHYSPPLYQLSYRRNHDRVSHLMVYKPPHHTV